jgi:oligopeptide transport system substrate-binding protein
MKRPVVNPLWPVRLVLAVLLAVAAAALVACNSDGGGNEGATNELAPDQELRIRIAGDPSTLDPQLAAYAEEISVVKQLFTGLFTYDEDLNVVPALALEVPTTANGGISEDGLTYTINMRDDAVWSDGTPVTAHDFVYAFQRLFDPEAGGQGYYAGFYTAIAGAGEFMAGEGTAEAVGVSAIDDHTLQIKLVAEQPTLPTLLALWPASPLRQDVIEQHGAAWTEPGNMISNGPFVLADYTPQDSIVLEANAAYVGDDEPTLQRMVYRIIPEDSAALIAYENGEIDMTTIPQSDASRFEGDAEQLRFEQLETYALQYNTAAPPFDNALVRQAFSQAIDREAYVASVLQGVGAAGTGWLPPGMPGYDASVGSDLAFDPVAAQATLAEAGYPNGDGFPSVTLTVGNLEPFIVAAEFVQAQLSENLGIDVAIEPLDEAAFGESYMTGGFQVVWQSWFADYADPENFLAQQFATEGGFNVFGYSNPQVDELLSQAATTLDQAERLALYDQAHRIIIDEDQAVTPIYYPQRNYLVKQNVGGLITTALDAEPGDWFVPSVAIFVGQAAPPASDPDEE